MAGKAKSSETDTTSVAQARFVVSLPKETGDLVDVIGARISETVAATTGVAFELTRSQVVAAIIKSAYAESNGSGNDETASES